MKGRLLTVRNRVKREKPVYTIPIARDFISANAWFEN